MESGKVPVSVIIHIMYYIISGHFLIQPPFSYFMIMTIDLVMKQ
jgi:hypothetical protein